MFEHSRAVRGGPRLPITRAAYTCVYYNHTIICNMVKTGALQGFHPRLYVPLDSICMDLYLTGVGPFVG